MEWGLNLQSGFQNVRVRLQRTTDARFFSGWMRQITADGAFVDLIVDEEIEVGDEFYANATGKDQSIAFAVKCVLKQATLISLKVSGPVTAMAPTEPARKFVSGQEITLSLYGVDIVAKVTDVSLTGMGLISAEPLKRGEQVKFMMQSPIGLVRGEAEVRYSKPIPYGYRVGLKVTLVGRIEQAIWNRLAA
jgi:hypothetical protein